MLQRLGSSLVKYKSKVAGSIERILSDKLSDTVSVKDFGAKGDGVTDDTQAFKAAADLGRKVYIPEGVYILSHLSLKTKSMFIGAGYTSTVLKQKVGSNQTFITAHCDDFVLKNLSVDGNYFLGAWNDANPTLGNTYGDGLDVYGFGFTIDILLNNIAGIGLIVDGGSEVSSSRHQVFDISVVGRDFGKEGIIIKGPNDCILRKAWIGRAGILPRPAAESQIAMSSHYQGSPVDGIVLDGVNIEIGDVHTYAHWSGTGFRTRGVCRLTKGGRIIAESSRAQVNINNTTYGAAFFDIRNLALYHPNWTQARPVYSAPDQEWDGATISAGADFACEITCKRTITSTNRVVGVTGVVKAGAARVDLLTYSNSTAPSGDPEAGQRYTGDALRITSNGGIASVNGRNANGTLCHVECEACDVTVSADDCVVGIKRVSPNNSKRGNNIRGTIRRCSTGFVASGNPTSERVDLSMELLTGQVPFSGDKPDFGRMQIWNISASVDNVGKGTIYRASAVLDASTTDAKTVSIPHKFLYLPDYRQVQLTIDDRSTPSTGVMQYCVVNNITESEIVVAYKFSTADATPASNLRVNVLIM